MEEGWWQGRRQGRVGVFPSNFVVMLDAQPAAFEPPPYEPVPALPPKPGMWPYGPGKVSYVNHCRFPFVCGRLLYLVRISFYLFIFCVNLPQID